MEADNTNSQENKKATTKSLCYHSHHHSHHDDDDDDEVDVNETNSIDSDYQRSDDSGLNNYSKLSTSNTICHSAGTRRSLVHSVSIIVEPAINMDDGDLGNDLQISPTVPIERRKTIAGPIVLLEDFYFDQPKKVKEYDDIVQSLFASARLRKEEFARLLEEHAQIVSEINKAETNLL